MELVRTGLPAVLGDVEPHLGPVRELAEVHAVLLRPLDHVAEVERHLGAVVRAQAVLVHYCKNFFPSKRFLLVIDLLY